jgi:hypothetical protein
MKIVRIKLMTRKIREAVSKEKTDNGESSRYKRLELYAVPSGSFKGKYTFEFEIKRKVVEKITLKSASTPLLTWYQAKAHI